MRDLSPGWATDLAVLEFTGSVVDECGDHLVVSTPTNPDYHWGNCLFVLDESAVDDAERWVTTFHDAFPNASWVSIGLTRMSSDAVAWSALGVDLELDDVLTTRRQPQQSERPAGYSVRQLSGADWEQSISQAIAENERTGEEERHSYERFIRAKMQTRRSISEQGVAAFFGAFHDGTLVADLGIVRCGTTARYQAVGTDLEHRSRGLASHLLGVAGAWAAQRGCDQWVIVTEATNPAGRVYRKAGFELNASNAQAYRAPSR